MQSSNSTAAAVAMPQTLTSSELDQANLHMEQTRNAHPRRLNWIVRGAVEV